MESKALLDLCKQAGFDVRNQLSSLEPDQQESLKQLVKQGSSGPQVVAPAKPTTQVLMPETKRVATLTGRARREETRATPAEQEQVVEETTSEPAPLEEEAAELAESKPVAPDVEQSPVAQEAETAAPEQPTPAEPAPQVAPAASETVAEPVPAPAAPVAPAAARPPQNMPSRVPNLSGGSRMPPRIIPGSSGPPTAKQPPRPAQAPAAQAPPGSAKPPPRREVASPSGRPGISRPLGPVAPPTLKPLKPLKPMTTATGEMIIKPISKLTAEHMQQKTPVRPEDLLKPKQPAGTGVEGEGGEEGDEDSKDKKKLKRIPGGARRQEERNRRAASRTKITPSQPKIGAGGKVIVDDDDSPRSMKIRAKKQRQATLPRKGNVSIEPPITVRSLSEAIGIRSVELLFKLRDHGAPANISINSALDEELALLVALDFGIGLDLKKGENPEQDALESYQEVDNPEDLVSRAPIVTIMGHVDHGKTSLLDKIRRSNVVATEAGGITQVIRAWRVEHTDADGKTHPITFLDTPGHEAFTKMRARGAQVTDIAVIVVAADDGVMPQTEEAINHARAAGVSLVVAINKIDMPQANLNRTRQQLYGMNLLPDNMGGDIPFVETSAATGKGIPELLEAITVVAELKELQANPNRAGQGTCLEAALSEGEGVHATLLVRNGTLRKGEIIVCGGSYGRIRQMYDDLGRPIEEAGPSMPVRITGLDEVPEADDPFLVMPEVTVAREIADRRKAAKQDSYVSESRAPLTLERLTEAKITELKVILKADFRGSVEAIRKELEKLQHAEVRVRVLEAAIGAITENDVWLALASPDDTMIVGFNVVPDDRAMALAEEKGVQIREYDIIYNLTNDIRAALEGKLKPREEVVHLGRAMVRDTFKISRVGTIAGCYVTQGIIRRNAKVRIIREGVVIYPPSDRSTGLDSLKRFKEDVSEVREGFECGIKVAGYDDIKVGDVVEAYRVDQVQRTLS